MPEVSDVLEARPTGAAEGIEQRRVRAEVIVQVRCRAKKRKSETNGHDYRSVAHLLSTSVIVESLFSSAELVLTDRRSSRHPIMLDNALFVRVDKQ